MAPSPGPAIRPKAPSDAAVLYELLDRIQRSEGYPPHRSGPASEFVTSPNELAAWVAELDGTVVGHVALHPFSVRAVMATGRRATGLPDEALAVPARIFVDPIFRGRGVGRALLRTATSAAHAVGRQPILDVATHFESAIALYESEGWRRVGHVSIRFRSPCTSECRHPGDSITSFVYTGPAP